MRIANNIPALDTNITLRRIDRQVAGAMRRLSSGSKINSVKDDAAGLAIANKLGIQVTGLNRASQNSMDGISMIQTADGYLNEVANMLQRMRELAVQAASGALNPADKTKIQMEVNQLIEEINLNADKAEFNKIKILSGEAYPISNGITAASAYADSIASVIYASPDAPPGFLRYTIDKPGFPAVASLDPGLLLHSDLTFTLNEVSVEITSADTIDTICGKLSDAANLASLELRYYPPGPAGAANRVYFSTKTAGSAQAVNIACAALTSIERQSNGTDAALKNVTFENPDGALNAAFNTGLSVRADGNQVTISNANGQSVRLALKVYFNPDGSPANGAPSASHFVYGSGPNISEKPPIAAPPASGTLDAAVNVKDYGPIYLQIGPNYNQHTQISVPRMDAESLGFIEHTSGAPKITLDYQSIAGASRAISVVDNAIADVTRARAWLGAYQNRLEQTVMNLDSASINMESARSRIQDTDMAAAMTEYTQYSVNYQAGIAILAQANQRPQQILSLLQ